MLPANNTFIWKNVYRDYQHLYTCNITEILNSKDNELCIFGTYDLKHNVECEIQSLGIH